MDNSQDYHAKGHKWDGKSQEPYDTIHMWDIKLTVTKKAK